MISSDESFYGGFRLNNNDLSSKKFGDILNPDIFNVYVAVHVLKMDSVQRDLEIYRMANYSQNNDDIDVLKIIKILNMSPDDFTEYIKITQISLKILGIYVSYLHLNSVPKENYLGLKLNLAQVKKSNTHGNGVFATQNIKCGDVITLYPFHVIINTDHNHFTFAEGITQVPYEKFAKYIYRSSTGVDIGGLSHIYDNNTFIGHIINDGCNLKNSSKYYKNNEAKINCAFFEILDPNGQCVLVSIVATKDIQMGEELFIQYGHNYWKNSK